VRWLRFLRRARRVAEAERELASYVELETDDNVARGMTRDEARHAALLKLGNPALLREEIYLMNTIGPIERLSQDLRLALRLLRREPGFAAAAVLSLALGIGANTALFQLLDAVRLRALPVERPHELVELRMPPGTSLSGSFWGRRPTLTRALFDELRQRPRSFAAVLGWSGGSFNTAAGGEVRYVEGLWASGGAFETLGLRPALGRFFGAEEDRPGCAPVAVLSHAYWQREHGGSPAVLGRTLHLDGAPFAVIGVAPEHFFGLDVGRRFDVAIPLCADAFVRPERARRDARGMWWLAAIGRLRPGVSIEQANGELTALSPPIMQATRPPNQTSDDATKYLALGLRAYPAATGVSALRARFGEPLVVLLAIAGLVLAIACANLANLLLARGAARERELAVRLAVGASRGRIVQQLLVESLLLASLGAGLSVAVARGLGSVLVSQLASGPSTFVDLSFTPRVLAFTSGVAVLTCLLFGLAPALRSTALAPAKALKGGGRGATAGPAASGLRRALVVTQVALSLVLLVGALLFTGTLRNLLGIETGLDHHVLVAELSHESLAGEAGRARAARRELLERLQDLPEVASVTQIDYVPLDGSFWNESVSLEGLDPKQGVANFARVGAGYFRTLGIPLVKGRAFDQRDTLESVPVAIVNETFVKKRLAGVDPIGVRIRVAVPPGAPVPVYEVVGVARDTKYQGLKDEFEPLVQVAASQEKEFGRSAMLAFKPRAGLQALTAAVTRRVAEVNPAIRLEYRTIDQAIRDTLVAERLTALLSAAFGILAMLLAAVGLYGVMSYSVARRAGEIGIRVALGASRAGVMRLVLGDAGRLLAAGLALGTALALAAARVASSLLYGLGPGDPLIFAAAIGLLASIGMLASALPALRAARLDPVRVLRED